MTTRESIARELAQIILSSAQSEADEGRGFMVPANVLADLRPPEWATVDVARRAVGIEDRVWQQEIHRHMVVLEIMHGVSKSHRPPPRVTVDLP